MCRGSLYLGDCDDVNFVQNLLGWIVSISNSCLYGVDLAFFFLFFFPVFICYGYSY